jgi:hypothetical protein
MCGSDSFWPAFALCALLQYLHYTRPSHMAQTTLDGATRRPVLPTQDVEGDADTPARQRSVPPTPGAASLAAASRRTLPADEGSREGVVADSVPPSSSSVLRPGDPGALQGTPGEPSSFDIEGGTAQMLAQRALRTLQSQNATMKQSGSWSGGACATGAGRARAVSVCSFVGQHCLNTLVPGVTLSRHAACLPRDRVAS